MILYSESKKEIYDTNIHRKEQIANDAKYISKEEHMELLKPKMIKMEMSKEQELELLIKKEIREMAIERLKARGEI